MTRTCCVLLAATLLPACTALFDTDVSDAFVDAGDTGTEADGGGDTSGGGILGACCLGDTCQALTATACGLLGGDYSAGLTCAQSGCVPSCASYCSEFVDSCATVSNDYGGLADCTLFCERDAQWDPGTFDDQTGNTIGCRTYHAGVANDPGQDRAFHCAHAGITGEEVCGSWCINYCHLAVHICDADPIFDGLESCLEACRDIPDDGQSGDTSGDSVQCRIYHLTAAARTPRLAAEHCGHAAPNSAGDVCSGPPPG